MSSIAGIPPALPPQISAPTSPKFLQHLTIKPNTNYAKDSTEGKAIMNALVRAQKRGDPNPLPAELSVILSSDKSTPISLTSDILRNHEFNTLNGTPMLFTRSLTDPSIWNCRVLLKEIWPEFAGQIETAFGSDLSNRATFFICVNTSSNTAELKLYTKDGGENPVGTYPLTLGKTGLQIGQSDVDDAARAFREAIDKEDKERKELGKGAGKSGTVPSSAPSKEVEMEEMEKEEGEEGT